MTKVEKEYVFDAPCGKTKLGDLFGGHRQLVVYALVAVSRAPLAKLEAFKKRMGWTHRWVSSASSPR